MHDLLSYFERRTAPADAADLLGDTLLVAWRRVRDLPIEPERARMWLFVVARNVLSNHQRGRRRAIRLGERLADELASQPLHAPAEDALGVRAAVDSLPAEQRELVRLVHWDGFGVAEAGEVMGVGASTARSRYATARHAWQSRWVSTSERLSRTCRWRSPRSPVRSASRKTS
jgi:RNA polymerase sigma factor (sigma-70 family)